MENKELNSEKKISIFKYNSFIDKALFMLGVSPIVIKNNERKLRGMPMFRRATYSRGRRPKRKSAKQGKLRNKKNPWT